MPTRAVGTRIFCPLFALPRGVLPAAYAGFSRGLFAKRPPPAPQRSICRAAHPLRHPRRSTFSSALHSRPGRIHGAPGLAICLSPPAPETAALCTPPREGTPCAPSVPSRGIRRRNGRGGGYRPGMGPVWRQHRRQFTQKSSIEPAVALAAVRCRLRAFTRFFARPFCKKADSPRRGALPAAPAHPLLPARQRFSCPPTVPARWGETGRGGQNPLQIPLRVAREIHLPTALSL